MAAKLALLEDELDRQPTGRVFLSKSNPLAVGVCAGAVHTQILAPNLVTGELPVLYGESSANPPIVSCGPAGLGIKASSSSSAQVPSYSIPAITGEYTLICVASVSDVVTIKSLIDADSYPSSRYMQFRVETNSLINAICFNSVDSVFSSYSSKAVELNIPFVSAIRLSGNSLCVALSGEIGTPVAVTGSLKTTHERFTIAGSQSSSGLDCVDGGAIVYAWIAFPYGLPDANLIDLTKSVKNFWRIFEPEEIPLFKPVAIGATLAQTESADTVTSAANVQLSASLAVTESNDSLSSAATVAISASLSVTESADTVSASATIIDGVNASLSVTESDDTLSASATVPLSASLSYTESADSTAGSATVTINATATLTETGDSISGVSVVEITATASLTESADSLSASATLVDGISASLNVTESADTLAAVANAAISAALASSESGDELSAQAEIALSAALNSVESGDTVVSSVGISVTCSASLSEDGDTLTATASIISNSNTITAASIVRLAEIWARMELDAARPLVTSATQLTIGTISQDISTGGAVRTGATLVPTIDPDTMIAEVWQRLGLDPDNALTQTNTSIDVGDIHLTVSGTDTLTVQRV